VLGQGDIAVSRGMQRIISPHDGESLSGVGEETHNWLQVLITFMSRTLLENSVSLMIRRNPSRPVKRVNFHIADLVQIRHMVGVTAAPLMPVAWQWREEQLLGCRV
jgi:hypothetical protein